MVFNWLRKKAPLITESRHYFDRFDQGILLKDCNFVVFDTELTGLQRRSGEIISIGAVRIENLQINLSQIFSEYIRPSRTEHTEATLIHRITPEELKSAPPLAEVIPRFMEYLGNSLIVGHCIAIDMEFVDKACRQLFGGTLSNPTIDTMRLARSYYGEMYGLHHAHGSMRTSYNLHELSKKFQLPIFAQHSALGDAMQTAYLFIYLIKKYQSGDLDTLSDLYRVSKTGTWIDYV